MVTDHDEIRRRNLETALAAERRAHQVPPHLHSGLLLGSMGALGGMNSYLGQHVGGLGNLAALAQRGEPTVKEQMQCEVNDWLRDWDK